MKAFLLAAGFGERLRPITDTMPKPLIPVVNVESICYSIMLLREAGINDVVCNVHHLGNEIIAFFDGHDRFGMNIVFSIEDEILGTGGGLMKCRGDLEDGDFVLLNSDIITNIGLADIIEKHRNAKNIGTIAISGELRGPASVSAAGDMVVDMSGTLNTAKAPLFDYIGAAVLSPEIFNHLTPAFSCIVSTGYRSLIEREALGCYEHRGWWYDIGTIGSYRETNMAMLKRINEMDREMFNATGISIMPVSESAQIGKDAIVNESVVCRDAVIGSGSVVKGSVILPGGRVNENDEIVNKVIW